ncbi:hypothetical protein PHLGIDRAFT_380703 [Phlebiopsis gigantea 11061_1 CR5-6]|uniref:Uncharacterized protein n=1 Tax=Phlebiopsis gigantea (strain 11061_1 CR5-6) TaxID=745531 RepID=A0A0C3SC03_PHLG1|nr:hypothetical protein PHLGIDRAFT_380703 [Phlebiopsis gigantea 11061_1 CR5-6]
MTSSVPSLKYPGQLSLSTCRALTAQTCLYVTINSSIPAPRALARRDGGRDGTRSGRIWDISHLIPPPTHKMSCCRTGLGGPRHGKRFPSHFAAVINKCHIEEVKYTSSPTTQLISIRAGKTSSPQDPKNISFRFQTCIPYYWPPGDSFILIGLANLECWTLARVVDIVTNLFVEDLSNSLVAKEAIKAGKVCVLRMNDVEERNRARGSGIAVSKLIVYSDY